MSFFSNSPNHFLASLSPQDSDLLRPHLKSIELPQGMVLHAAQDVITRVYFPERGVVSLVVHLANGQFVEAGMSGRNGAVGAGVGLDGRLALNQAIIQVAGSASIIDATTFRQFVQQSETLRNLVMKNELAVYAQTQQVAACNAVHHLEERMCRWLLQTRDLVKSDTLLLTQEFLSEMLGVQRSSVTLVARKLQAAELITYRRGRIHVLDVDGVRESCCECYGAINGHFERLIGWHADFNGDHAEKHKA